MFKLPNIAGRLGAMPDVKDVWGKMKNKIPGHGSHDVEHVEFAKQQGSGSHEHDMSSVRDEWGEVGESTGYTQQTSFMGGEGEGDDGGGGGWDDQGNRMRNGSIQTMDIQEGDDEEIGEFSSKVQIDEWQAGWNVTNAIQGMFVVSLPYAVMTGGYWGIVAMVGVAYVCCHTGKILVECLYETNEKGEKIRVRQSYVGIAQVCFGQQYGGKIVNMAQLIELLMTCILYVVLCGDLMVGCVGGMNNRGWMFISGMILLPCAFLKTLHSVSFLSFWCTMVHLVINVVIVGYCLLGIGDWYWSDVMFIPDLEMFPVCLGIVVFSYTSQIFLPTLEGSLKDRSKFGKMLDWSHIAAAAFKGSFAYIGFLRFGYDTEEEVTNNLPRGFKSLVNFILVLKALLSYPLPFFAAIQLIETALFKGRPKTMFPSCYGLDHELKVWGLAMRVGLVGVTVVMAIFIPHFATLMGLIGSFTGTMLSLIWPCYFHLKLKKQVLEKKVIYFDYFIMGLGFFCCTFGIYSSLSELVRKYNLPLNKVMKRI